MVALCDVKSSVLAITSGGKNPIGMYRRRSEEVFGIARYCLEGWRISPKRAGVSASFFVASLSLSKRVCLTSAIRLVSSGCCRILEGGASTSQKQERSIPLMYSTDPKKGRISCLIVGSDSRIEGLSPGSMRRYPPSLGILPNESSGAFEMGERRLNN